MTLPKRLRKVVAGVSVGLGVGLAAAILCFVRPDFLERGELWTYDVRVRQTATHTASTDIVIIDIAEDDLKNAAENFDVVWPWPREMHGYLLDYLTGAGAKVVVFDWIFQGQGRAGSGGEAFATSLRNNGRSVFGLLLNRNPGLPAIARAGPWAVFVATLPDDKAWAVGIRLTQWGTRVFVVGRSPATVYVGGDADPEDASATWQRLSRQEELADLFTDAPTPQELTDDQLADELTAERVVRRKHTVAAAGAQLPTRFVDPPLPVLAEAAARLGNVVQGLDVDGMMRRHQLLVQSEGDVFPSLPLAAYLIAHPNAKVAVDGHTIQLGDRRVAIDDDGNVGIFYHGGRYVHVSAYKTLASIERLEEGEPPYVPQEVFRDKYVIISASAASLRDVKASPVGKFHLGAAINANVLENLIAGRFVRRGSPALDALLAWLLAMFVALAVATVWTAVRSGVLALVATVGVAGLVGTGYYFFSSWLLSAHGLWTSLSTPALGAVLAMLGAVLATSAVERRDRRFVQEALGRYTSPALVRELVENPQHLSLEWGQQRPMSVFFSDIAGFTSFSEALSAQRLVALLNDYLTHMTDIVLAHDGIVDKYIGDAIMAFWGAPLTDEDHARKSVRAALAMEKKCHELRPRWKKEYGHDVFARAGINSGLAVVGNMGSKHKYNYTVMGDMVNVASRLEGANKPYGTLFMVSEATHDAVCDEVDSRELDVLAVKGKKEPLRVFEVIAPKGQAPAGFAEAAGHFAAGLAKYRATQFAEAISDFEKGLAARPEDGPCKTFVERCQRLRQEPPGENWDGVWRLKEK